MERGDRKARGLTAFRALRVAALALAVYPLAGCEDVRGQGEAAFDEEMDFEVTAYCTGTVTQSGARVREGMAAADPRVLPIGSTVRVEGRGTWDGVYTVMDTGRTIRGRELDLYLKDCDEAQELGRREMKVRVIRRGWHPAATPEAQNDGR